MRTVSIVLAALMVAGGCALLPTNFRSGPDPGRDQELYRVRLIRPGMTLDEADRIALFRDRQNALNALSASAVSERCSIVVDLSPDGKVVETRTDVKVTFSLGKIDEKNTDYLQLLKFGMSPIEVAEQIGPPKYGYENTSGTVVLLYDVGPGLEITFVNGKVEKWRRTQNYEKSPQKKLTDEQTGLPQLRPMP